MLRGIAIFIFLGYLLFAAAWADEDGNTSRNESVTVSPRATPPEKNQDMPVLPLEKLRPRREIDAKIDAFAAKSWYVPPPPPKPEFKPPPKPSAPPLPFTYMGQFQEESGKPIVYLVNNDRVYIARKDDVIDNIYRVDEVNEQSITFTYLPMSTKQTLTIAPAL